MLRQACLFIEGDVIGVGFRAWTKIQAKLTGVKGWVRNHKDGFVETVIQGDEDKVGKMIEILKQGSPVSRITNVEIFHQDPKEVFSSFEILK